MKRIIAAILLLSATCVFAAERISYQASVSANGATGGFAPYMLGSWNSGRVYVGKGIWHDGLLHRDLDLSRRFSWAYGAEYIAGIGTGVSYERWRPELEQFTPSTVRQANIRLIQAYGALKYRQVYLLIGMKERGSRIVDGELSAGDYVRSNNARPIPGAAAGFLDFVDIPFTNGWVQIDGEVMYGKFFDNGERIGAFNHYNGTLNLSLYYNYKRCYFRSNPRKPFSLLVGLNTATMFGGSQYTYSNGKIIAVESRGLKIKDIFDVLIPREGSGEDYYKGQTLGSWDLKAVYRFRNDSRLTFYVQKPWEDGSGVGFRTGWDGIWGLQYDMAKEGWLSKVLVEYIDFTNMSGPMHFAPSDNTNTTLEGHTNGADNYYNNGYYGPYVNYGMAIGTPFMLAPVYNRDGRYLFKENKTRGFHFAATGMITPQWKWRAMVSYQKSAGTTTVVHWKKLHNTSAMLEASWLPTPHWTAKARIALDHGDLRGNNFGGALSVAYHGDFTLGKK